MFRALQVSFDESFKCAAVDTGAYYAFGLYISAYRQQLSVRRAIQFTLTHNNKLSLKNWRLKIFEDVFHVFLWIETRKLISKTG